MTEQQMPAKFRITWKDGRYVVDIPNYEGGEVVRSDIAERMAEALEALVQSADDLSWSANSSMADRSIEAARSALSAFKDSAR